MISFRFLKKILLENEKFRYSNENFSLSHENIRKAAVW